jgi:hypothetical protein
MQYFYVVHSTAYTASIYCMSHQTKPSAAHNVTFWWVLSRWIFICFPIIVLTAGVDGPRCSAEWSDLHKPDREVGSDSTTLKPLSH